MIVMNIGTFRKAWRQQTEAESRGDQQADREPSGVRHGDVPHVQERS